MVEFFEILQQRARQIATGSAAPTWDRSLPSSLRRQIALTLDQMRRQDQLHERQLLELLRAECAVGTDLLQLQQRIPRYTPHHFPEKEKLKKRLSDIDKERRALNQQRQDKVQSLEDRLLTLIHTHEQIDI
jgi:hypothetical protein